MTEIRNLVLALVMFSGVVIGMSSFYGSLVSNYSISGAEDLSSMNVSTTIIERAESMENSLRNTNPIEGAFFIAITAPWSALMFTFDAVQLMQTIISDSIVHIVGIPAWLFNIAWAGVLVVVIYEILSIIFRWRI